MPMEGRGLHSKGLTEDTLSVLRDGGNNGNEIIARPENNAKKAVRQGANYKERI